MINGMGQLNPTTAFPDTLRPINRPFQPSWFSLNSIRLVVLIVSRLVMSSQNDVNGVLIDFSFTFRFVPTPPAKSPRGRGL